ncbi:hypothetical protein CDAR_520051 [Caerostris darwini]|uniref:Uncharacterized protein n=1 Tax=Caerostris darwini TaxID=1538125 RepID=A0AAV4WP60_9ARAC|nr:hypothetical protein CDAR_520051 [Caerostris darwini]
MILNIHRHQHPCSLARNPGHNGRRDQRRRTMLVALESGRCPHTHFLSRWRVLLFRISCGHGLWGGGGGRKKGVVRQQKNRWGCENETERNTISRSADDTKDIVKHPRVRFPFLWKSGKRHIKNDLSATSR